jgi:hypothetical protein
MRSGRSFRLSEPLAVVLMVALVWGLGAWAGAYYQSQAGQSSAPEPVQYERYCSEGGDNLTKGDLCQQWRSAVAAERMVLLTALGLGASIVGVIGLGLTLYFSRLATLAASQAADAATRSAIAAIRIELPLLSVGSPDLIGMNEAPPPRGSYGGSIVSSDLWHFNVLSDLAFRNNGRTTATVLGSLWVPSSA